MNHVAILLDETGSMSGQEARVVSGINEFINKLKKDMGKKACTVTLNLFDSERWRDYYSGALKDFPAMTEEDYNPGSMTPLYDCVAKVISGIKANGKDKVMVVVDTDGLNNASREHTADSIQRLVKEKEEAGWAFVFMAAGLDKDQQGQVATMGVSMGIPDSNTMGLHHGSRTAAYACLAGSADGYFSGRLQANSLFDKDQVKAFSEENTPEDPTDKISNVDKIRAFSGTA